MKNKSYKPVIVSGSLHEIIYPFAQQFDINEVFATTCEIIDGQFTGILENNMILGEVKQKIIKLYIQNNLIDPKSCAGFGDTEQDISFLGLVGYPVAIKPNEELERIGKEKNFCICHDDNQVVDSVKSFLQ